MKIRVIEVEPFMRRMRSRMPFRFGTTVMTGMPVLHLRVRLMDEQGRNFEGWSACGLVSMWFDKDYSKPQEQRESDLMYSVGEAVKAYVAAEGGTAWDLHREVELPVRRLLQADGLNGLTAGYGIALVDAAIIDGVCRYAGLSFYEGLQAGVTGFDPSIAGVLPAVPSAAISLRHTIGLGDPLTAGDVTEPLNDGLPQTLEEVIKIYGARFFKIKVNNDIAASLSRLRQINSVLEATGEDYQATLDGNEAFPDMDSFVEFASTCATAPDLQTLWNRVLWIEQPVARHAALEPAVAAAVKKVSTFKPVIIDESDDEDAALERALALGYAGISAKNCKGVFRTLKSFLYLQSVSPGGRLVLSSEDLTNQPIVPNHQDLCVAAALGLTHSERNGHHFFRGFEFLSEAERAQSLRDYPSLYGTTESGLPSLRFENGRMCMGEINASRGIGVVSSPDWSAMEPVSLPEAVHVPLAGASLEQR